MTATHQNPSYHNKFSGGPQSQQSTAKTRQGRVAIVGQPSPRSIRTIAPVRTSGLQIFYGVMRTGGDTNPIKVTTFHVNGCGSIDNADGINRANSDAFTGRAAFLFINDKLHLDIFLSDRASKPKA